MNINRLYLILAAFISLLLGACAKDVELDETTGTLQLSATSVTFSPEDAEQIVSVQASAPSWSYVSGSEWLTAEKVSSGLKLTASPNTTGRARRTNVVVTLGRLVQELIVHQEVTSSSLEIATSDLKIDGFGGDLELAVTTTSTDWVAYTEDEWLRPTVNFKKGVVYIAVEENNSREERTGEVFILDKRTGEEIDVQVHQSGGLYFILPSLSFGADLTTVQAFEEARRSTLIGNEAVTGSPNTRKYTFTTKSAFFHRTEYIFTNSRLVEAYHYVNLPNVIAEESVWLAWMSRESFIKVSGNTWVSDQLESVAKSLITGSELSIQFIYRPRATRAYTTFSSFPFDLLNARADWSTFTRQDLETWETARQWSLVNSTAAGDVLLFRPQTVSADMPFTQVRYLLSTKAERAANPLENAYYTGKRDIEDNRIYWVKDGLPYVTTEFLNLMTRNGYLYQSRTQRSGGVHVERFQNTSKKAAIFVILTPNSQGAAHPFMVDVSLYYSGQ